MTCYDLELISLIENDINDDSILELSIPTPIDSIDFAQYKTLLKTANDIIENNGGDTQPETMVNIILDLIKFMLNIVINGQVADGVRKIVPVPNEMGTFFTDMSFHIKITKFNGEKKLILLNPFEHIMRFFIGGIVDMLIECTFSPIRAKYMVKSYKKIIAELEKVKRTCDDKKIEKQCQYQIDKINKAIKVLESKVIKEENYMKSFSELLEEELYFNESESSIEDDIIAMAESAIAELEESSCRAKKESTDEEDDDDLDSENESFDFDMDLDNLF